MFIKPKITVLNEEVFNTILLRISFEPYLRKYTKSWFIKNLNILIRKSLVILSVNKFVNLMYFNFIKPLIKTIKAKLNVTVLKISFSLVMFRKLKKVLNKLLNK